jgi:hypothetical protein
MGDVRKAGKRFARQIDEAYRLATSRLRGRLLEGALAPDDIEDWHKGDISTETLAAFARSLVQRREMEQGNVPANYTERATCKHCGPIWLWFAGDVLGCPWCWNRAAGRPIPRP